MQVLQDQFNLGLQCLLNHVCLNIYNAQRGKKALYTTANSKGPDQHVCVEVLRPGQPNRVMSSVVSLPNHTFTGQA